MTVKRDFKDPLLLDVKHLRNYTRYVVTADSLIDRKNFYVMLSARDLLAIAKFLALFGSARPHGWLLAICQFFITRWTYDASYNIAWSLR